jgi:hypothetical protein
MTPEDHYRQFVLEAIVADTPEAFWRRATERTQFVYGDSYTSVATDPALLPEQRTQKLYQERYFKMEYALIDHVLCPLVQIARALRVLGHWGLHAN